MIRIGLVLLALAAAPLAAMRVALPDREAELPPGPRRDLAVGACTACHSAEMIMTQPRLDRRTWTATVEKMVKVYKAPVEPGDVAPITDYLVAVNGVGG